MSRPLPGIRVDVAAPAVDAVLPRMDIAVFVGFASCGPMHLPLPVESAAQYQAVFGDDAVLAYDASTGTGTVQKAYLGPAVRAFFSNGGQRCWVIRVARTAALAAAGAEATTAQLASYNRFAMPGVLALKKLSSTPSYERADLIARCEGSWSDGLSSCTALLSADFTLNSLHHASALNQYRFRTSAALSVGDLIVFADPAVADANAGRRAFAIVLDVNSEVGTGTAAQRRARLVQVQCCGAFAPLGTASATLQSGLLHLPGTSAVTATLQELDGAVRITAQDARPATTLQPGQWVMWHAPAETVWLRVDDFDRSAAPGPVLHGKAWRVLPSEMPFTLASVTRAAALTLDLRVDDGNGGLWRNTGLGLTPAHPASWLNLQTDEDFYSTDDDVSTAELDRKVALGSRFALAADPNQAAAAWLPLGVESLFGAAVGADPQVHDALERDGLSKFDLALFVDPQLGDLDLEDLPAQAELIAYTSDAPRALLGLHAALGVGQNGAFDEATLIAIPDAVHRGWQRYRPVAAAAAPSTPFQVPAHWRTHRGACPPAANDDAPLTAPDSGRLLDCNTFALAAPVLAGPVRVTAPAPIELSWSASAGALDYVLEESLLNDFSDAQEIYRGSALDYAVRDREPADYYYRVSAVAGDETSPPSNAVAVACIASQWRAIAPSAYATHGVDAMLVNLHRALLRCCAASGNLVAALSVPQHYAPADAIRHAERLQAQSGPADAQALSPFERIALSYGALYQPWLAYGRYPQTPSETPPDGAVLGAMAATAIGEGAWVASANVPLRDVIAMSPPTAASDWQSLLDAQVNLLREEARGYVVMGSDTLSDDSDLRPLNVRRLLILLRRLSLREGANYVFEPNGDALRRAVRRRFSGFLTDLFQQGAFSGATPAQSFQLVMDGGINTSDDQDNGRFIIELRVAPSVPMRFLNLRLQQIGERLTVAESA